MAETTDPEGSKPQTADRRTSIFFPGEEGAVMVAAWWPLFPLTSGRQRVRGMNSLEH